MAAILRVKRRHDEPPLDALIVACKRRKIVVDDEQAAATTTTPSSGETPVTAVVKFAGTVKNQEDDVVQHITKTLDKEELKTNFKQHVVDITSKVRKQTKADSQESRYKVVNCFRSLDSSALEDEKVTVIDVEDQQVPSKVDTNIDYVYDLYFTQTSKDIILDDLVTVLPYEQELVFDTYREHGLYSDNECESEDSNSESNWKNDYPDSDQSHDSVENPDIQEAVQKFRLNDEDDLSSDEDFVYAIDEDDLNTHGYKYAKYKARIKEELDDDDSDVSEYSESCLVEEVDD